MVKPLSDKLNADLKRGNARRGEPRRVTGIRYCFICTSSLSIWSTVVMILVFAE